MTSYLIIAALIVALVMTLAPVLVALLAMRGQFRANEATEIDTESFPMEVICLFEQAEDKLESLGFEYTHSQYSALDELNTPRSIYRYYWHPEFETYAASYKALEESYAYPYNVTFSTIFETGLVVETDDCTRHLQLPFPDICEHHDHGFSDIDKQWEMHQHHIAQQEFPEKIKMTPEWCLQWQSQMISESLQQMLNRKIITLNKQTGYYQLRFLAAYRMGTRILRGPNRLPRKTQALGEALNAALDRASPKRTGYQLTHLLNRLFRARAVYLSLIFAGLVAFVALKFEQAEYATAQRSIPQNPPVEALIASADSPEKEYQALVKTGDFYQELGSNTNARINYRAAVETALGAGFKRETAEDFMHTRLKLATSYEESVMVRKNIFVMLDESRSAGDHDTELAVLEYVVTNDIPAFSIKEKLEFATRALEFFSERSMPHGETRTIRLSQHMAELFDRLGLAEEATELRKQIVIHRRALLERKS